MMKTATVVNGRTFLNYLGYECTQTEYRLDPPCNGHASVVVSHVDPADGCDPTGVFLGETLDGGDLSFHDFTRTYHDVMTDDRALQTLGYMVAR